MNGETSDIRPMKAGVTQRRVLGSILYLAYTSDLPTTDFTITDRFADNPVFLSIDEHHIHKFPRPTISTRKVESKN